MTTDTLTTGAVIDDPVQTLRLAHEEGRATLDSCAAALTRTLARLREIEADRAVVEDIFVALLVAAGTDFVSGEIRWYAGHRSVTKCADVRAVLEVLFTVTVGEVPTNVAEIAACLTSDPFKRTEIKLLLEGRLPEGLFVTEQRPRLLEGKPKKVLLSSNERFVKGRRPTATAAAAAGPDLMAEASEVF